MPSDLLRDGLLLSSIAAVYAALLSHRVLRREAGWVTVALLAVVAAAALLRTIIPREALLTAWTYTRTVPLARAIAEGPVFDALRPMLFDRPIYLTEVVFETNLALASLTPLALFLHARFLLKDVRMALVAAGLLAVLPAHITFARSDVYFMQSLFFSSLAFATLYSALSDPDRRWRLLSLIFLGPLLWSVYLVRPLNLLFHPLFIATIFVTVGPDVPMGRRIIAAVVVTIPAIMDLVLNLMVGYGAQLEEGLGLRTLVQAWSMLFDFDRNTVLNPRVTPPVVPLLMAIGLVSLWRSGKRAIALYLAGWFVAFFVTHAYIVPFRTTMMARYHLHLLSPLVLMAAAATPVVAGLPRVAKIVLALYLLASPLLHLGFERDVEFSIQREFRFLTSLRERIPEGCTVIDFVGPSDCPRGPRLERVAAYAGSGARWRSVPLVGAPRLDRPDREPPRDARRVDQLRPILAQSGCTLYYEGNLCRAYGSGWSDLAPACRAMHELYDLRPVAEHRYREYVYDPADARGICGRGTSEGYVPPTDTATLRLYRVTAPTSPPAGAPGEAAR